MTITTANGELKASTVILGDVVIGDVFAQVARINPATSTGRFAGATGVIYFSGKTIGSFEVGPYQSQITGEICFPDN
jgi:hypothetical protein